jgi:hypothetical protein
VRLLSSLLLLSFALGAHAAGQAPGRTVYRCTVDGKTSYADRPCERGASVALPPAAGVDASLGTVQGDDSRTLLELEKLRLAREGRERAAERQDIRAARAGAAHDKQCRRLRLRAKWAEEDLARSHGGKLGKEHAAQLRLRRARESLAVECAG